MTLCRPSDIFRLVCGWLFFLPLQEIGEQDVAAVLGGMQINGTVTRDADELTVWLYDVSHCLQVHDSFSESNAVVASAGDLTAPMPGRVTRIMVEEGADVRRGAVLLVLEAMKMEHNIVAPSNGRVDRLKFSVGDWVDEGIALLDFSTVV